MNVCRLFGTEFDGNFCPMCGTCIDVPDSSDVALSSYEDAGAERGGETEPLEDFGEWPAMNTKEKNVLEYVRTLLLCGGFPEAERYLTDIEKEEVSKLGRVSAAVYYFKILARYRVSSDEEQERKLVRMRWDLKSDTDYRMVRLSYDCGYKDRINAVEKKVEKSFLTGVKSVRGAGKETDRGKPHKIAVGLSAFNVLCVIVGLVFWRVGPHSRSARIRRCERKTLRRHGETVHGNKQPRRRTRMHDSFQRGVHGTDRNLSDSFRSVHEKEPWVRPLLISERNRLKGNKGQARE